MVDPSASNLYAGGLKENKQSEEREVPDSMQKERLEEFKQVKVKPFQYSLAPSKKLHKRIEEGREMELQKMTKESMADLEEAKQPMHAEAQRIDNAAKPVPRISKKRSRLEIEPDSSTRDRSAACAWDEYKYTKLCDLKEGMKRVNVWGVIYDVPSEMTFANGNRRIHYMIKLVDETTNSTQGEQPYVSVSMFFARNLSIHKKLRRGRIIRIHRAEARVFGGEVRLNCDEYIKSSWILFTANKRNGDVPLAYDKESYTWVDKDTDRLKELRTLARRMGEERAANGGAAIMPAQALPKDSIWFIAQRGPDAKKSIYYLKSLDQREARYVYADKVLKQLARNYNYFIMDGTKTSESKNKVSMLTPLTDPQAAFIEHFYSGTGSYIDLANAPPILLKLEDFGKYKRKPR